MFGYNVIYFGKDCEGIDEKMAEKHVFGRVLYIPNKKKNTESYTIQYDPMIHNPSVIGSYITTVPNIKEVKGWLNEVCIRADIIVYRF